jgi:hypothetical protein
MEVRMGEAFSGLLVVEVVLTAAAVLMVLYRSMLDMKEEDHIILDNAESHLAREQDAIRRKTTVLSKYIKVVSVAWGVLAVVIFGLWVVEGLKLV